MNQIQSFVTIQSDLEFVGKPRRPSSAPSRRACDQSTLDVLYDHLRTALRPASLRFGWSQELLEDAQQEILLRLFQLHRPEVWLSLRQEEFGTPENADLRDLFLRVVGRVVEKFRNRHKVEIKCNSIDYDNSANSKKRQRRDLQSDRHLCDRAAMVEDTRHHDTTDPGLKLDVSDAINALEPTARAIVLRRVVEDKPWRTIADDLGLPLKTVKNHYRHAMARLTDELQDYDRPKPAAVAENLLTLPSSSD
jgi:DNA-directed RNA polymerase specialized sigma24 family protein